MSNRTSPARTPVTIYLSAEEVAEVDAIAATSTDGTREDAAYMIFRVGFLADTGDPYAEDDEED